MVDMRAVSQLVAAVLSRFAIVTAPAQLVRERAAFVVYPAVF